MELEFNLFWYPIEKHSFYIKYHLNIHFIPFYDKASIKQLWILKHALNKRKGEICAFYRIMYENGSNFTAITLIPSPLSVKSTYWIFISYNSVLLMN